MISFIQYINESSNEEEEHQRQWEPHEKMRISQRILNVKRGETSADKRKEEKAKAVTRTKAELDDSDTRLSNILRRAETEQGHKQPSLVMSKGKDFAKPVTDKGRKGVEAETKQAAASADSLMDIINKHPSLKNRFEKGGTRREREARGQGRLFPHRTDIKTRTEKGSEAKK
jgi:hypothetical protein